MVKTLRGDRTMTEEELFNKIKSGQELTESELGYLLDYELTSERDEYDERRWVMGTYSIVELKGEYFGLNWDRALTEMQEHYFYDQPKKVVRKEEVVTKTVVTWEEIA